VAFLARCRIGPCLDWMGNDRRSGVEDTVGFVTPAVALYAEAVGMALRTRHRAQGNLVSMGCPPSCPVVCGNAICSAAGTPARQETEQHALVDLRARTIGTSVRLCCNGCVNAVEGDVVLDPGDAGAVPLKGRCKTHLIAWTADDTAQNDRGRSWRPRRCRRWSRGGCGLWCWARRPFRHDDDFPARAGHRHGVGPVGCVKLRRDKRVCSRRRIRRNLGDLVAERTHRPADDDAVLALAGVIAVTIGARTACRVK
jgi:hypothetical protein